MIKKSILQNGLTVITKNDTNAKTTTISYTIQCGSYDENESNYGIAHFTEHMLFKGTTSRNSREISEEIEKVGGILNASTSFNFTKYYCTIPSDVWRIGTELLSDLVWNNTIPEQEFEREKQVIIEELKMYDDDASAKIFDLLFTEMHPSYKNRQLVGGTIQTVTDITREQMVEFIDNFYIPSNILVTATGNINHDELIKLIDELCPDLPNKKLSIKEFTPDTLNNINYVETKDIIQSHLAWGMFCSKPNDFDFITGQVVATILGGNSSSRLFQIIREEKGLAYTVSMDCDPVKDISLITGYVGLDGNNINEVKKILLDEFNKIKTEYVMDNELQLAKSYLNGY